MRVLLIEDDRLLGKAVFTGLKQEFAADWFRTAEEGDDALKMGAYDTIVLDINLPGMSGLEWLQQLRKRQVATPVLLLTARDTPPERVAGLNSGADDYLVKPFDFEELVARIRALGRRQPQLQPAVLRFGGLTLDTRNKTALLEGKPLSLVQKEFEILRLLIERPGEYITKEKLEQKLYGWDDTIGSNTIEVYISGLRRKLGKEFIRTTRNLGYRVEAA